jgi:pectin methylesterase-like acyl-CoA thioesterase
MNMKKTILAVAGVLLVGADANAATPKTLYVDDDPVVVDGATLGSEGNPYTTIQAAVDAAAGGDTIVVAEGVYTQGETVLIDGNNSYSRVCIRKKPGLKLIGAGRGKSVIVGSRDPEADDFVVEKKKIRSMRLCERFCKRDNRRFYLARRRSEK